MTMLWWAFGFYAAAGVAELVSTYLVGLSRLNYTLARKAFEHGINLAHADVQAVITEALSDQERASALVRAVVGDPLNPKWRHLVSAAPLQKH